jgi:cobalamin biosynthesis protein CobD/CbiB
MASYRQLGFAATRMFDLRRFGPSALTALFGLFCWLAAEQTASAQILLAQSGTAKTILGWLLSLLAIALGLLVVCRPSSRKDQGAKEKKR